MIRFVIGISGTSLAFSIPALSIQRLLTLLTLTVAFFASVAALYVARWSLLIALVGIGTGVILLPIVTALSERLKIPRALGATFLVLMIFGVLVTFGYLIIALVSDQFVQVLNRLSDALEQLRHKVMILPPEWNWLKDGLHAINPMDFLKKTGETLVQGVGLSVILFFAVIFVVALAGYLTVNPERYLRGVLSAFPAYRRPRVRRILQESALALRSWFRAQLISLTCVGLLAATGLWLLDVDYWLVIGLITAVCEVVPYAGPISASVVAVFFTFASHPDKVVWVLGLYVAIQQLEGNFITPVVLKERIELPPVHLLVMLLLMGQWFGILGVLVTPGLFTVSRKIYLLTIVPKTDRMTNSSKQ